MDPEGGDQTLIGLLELIVQDQDKLVFCVVGLTAVLWVLIATVGSTLRAKARERTKREIAAYVAEGSMSPEQGERLLRARSKEN